jgi:hypothetical protein
MYSLSNGIVSYSLKELPMNIRAVMAVLRREYYNITRAISDLEALLETTIADQIKVRADMTRGPGLWTDPGAQSGNLQQVSTAKSGLGVATLERRSAGANPIPMSYR